MFATYVESELHLSCAFIDFEHRHIDQFKLVLNIAIVIFGFQIVIRFLVWPIVLNVFQFFESVDKGDEVFILGELLERLCVHEQVLAEITVRLLGEGHLTIEITQISRIAHRSN